MFKIESHNHTLVVPGTASDATGEWYLGEFGRLCTTGEPLCLRAHQAENGQLELKFVTPNCKPASGDRDYFEIYEADGGGYVIQSSMQVISDNSERVPVVLKIDESGNVGLGAKAKELEPNETFQLLDITALPPVFDPESHPYRCVLLIKPEFAGPSGLRQLTYQNESEVVAIATSQDTFWNIDPKAATICSTKDPKLCMRMSVSAEKEKKRIEGSSLNVWMALKQQIT